MTVGVSITHEQVLADLVASLGTDIVVNDPDIVAGYERDQSVFTENGCAAAVLAPRSTDEVAACLAHAHRSGLVVVPRGAGSGLSGGANASAGSVILSLHRMTDILEIDSGNRTVRVQPGVVTAALRSAVAEHGLHYPPDPGSVEFCTVGGNIATNAGGMCCVKYGVTGDFVLALEVVLADGRVLRTGHDTVKGVAGYDLVSLFVGSEGTLGVITEATLRVVPTPRAPHTMVASFPTLDSAGCAVRGIIEAGLTPSMLEILDRTTVRAVDTVTRMGIAEGVAAVILVQSDDADAGDVMNRIESICTPAGATDVVTTDDRAEAAMLLDARRMALPALEQLGDWMLDDVCVPRTRITDLIAAIETISTETGLTIGVFGHAGDGNLHPTIVFDGSDDRSRGDAVAAFDAITAAALALGGTVTGEHGVGTLKRRWLSIEQGSLGIEIHRAIKDALDPNHTLNPAALFDTEGER